MILFKEKEKGKKKEYINCMQQSGKSSIWLQYMDMRPGTTIATFHHGEDTLMMKSTHEEGHH